MCITKKSEDGDDDNDQKIYASMVSMFGNDEISSRYFGDSSQLTNCILDSGAACNMTPKVSHFIPGSLEYINKYTEVADGHYITAK